MNKKDYDFCKDVQTRIEKKKPTTFAERNKRNMILKGNKKNEAKQKK